MTGKNCPPGMKGGKMGGGKSPPMPPKPPMPGTKKK